ncbi:general secretion pathway protein GspB [Caenimonas koreensis]|uniref:Type II secretion system protein GspB C-terminal domain-containing protein n=1 Tax=Caenimonas koreensis DSM 17982 TaxID=1121255 RepID=A0A844APP4_9BURK|nr:general secretion pathway protein GspB [Caenimonas koreensis]MRD45914.1 hypothetical protein [Caenimonas koreensis DSM 17982]
MSYILDALRKADAQRARESAQGINSQGARLPSGVNEPGRLRPWYYVGAGVAVVAVAFAAWALYNRQPEVSQAQAVKAQQAQRDDVVAAAPVIINAEPRPQPQPGEAIRMPMMAPMGPVVGSKVMPESPQLPPQFTQQAQPRFTGKPQAAPRQLGSNAPGVAPLPLPPAQQQPPGMEPPAMPTAPPAATGPAPIAPLLPPVAANAPPAPPVAGLPADAPKLSISGGVYSANRAQRMLIVNGQVFSEGSEITSGVVLEEVKPKIAVLKFRGARYSVSY